MIEMSQTDGWVENEGVWTKQIDISDNLLAKMIVNPSTSVADGFIVEKKLTPAGEESTEIRNFARYDFRSYGKSSLQFHMKQIEDVTLSCI